MIGNELKLAGPLGEVAAGNRVTAVNTVVLPDDQFILIRDCVAGNQTAQKKLYDRYAPLLYSIIKRYLYQDDGSAGEILNDSFLKIFTKLGQYQSQGSFEGWMRRIVINTITDHLRKTIRDDRKLVEVQPETAYIDSNGIGNIAYKELLKMVQALPDTQRAVFNLFVFENYSHKEISELLNIKENNSRWHLNDARKKLKEKLSAHNKK